MKDYGLLEKAQEIGAYILGDRNVPFIPYQQDSDWSEFFVRYENQSIPGFETFACTCFAITTQIEILEKRLYGVEKNYSDRWLAIVSDLDGTKGTDPQTVYDAIREYGLIPESMLPFNDDINTKKEYFSFKGADREACYAEGKRWLEQNEVRHDWLWKDRQRPANYLEVIKDAQRTSPIAISVSAWNEVNGEFVSDQGSVNNHLTLGVRFRDGREQAFDTYEQDGTNLKILAKDHNIRRAKRIHLQKRTKSAMRKDISTLTLIVNFLKSLVK